MKRTNKSRRKTQAQVLEHASKNMLFALKKDMLIKEGCVDLRKFRKDGYSERLLARLDEA